jgi:hypothetical protein
MNWSFYIKYKDFEGGLKIQRNAWLTVSLAIIAIGGAILTTPFWMEVANAISTKFFGLTLLDGYSWLYGFLCILIGVVLFVYGQKVTVDQDLMQKHDLPLFKEMDAILPEVKLNAILSNLENDHSYYNDDDNTFHNLFFLTGQTGKTFINEKLQAKATTFINSLKNFDRFAKKEFDIFPRTMTGNYRLCLKPNWNIDRDLDMPDTNKELSYDKLADEMGVIIKQIRADYNVYRTEVKRQLHI